MPVVPPLVVGGGSMPNDVSGVMNVGRANTALGFNGLSDAVPVLPSAVSGVPGVCIWAASAVLVVGLAGLAARKLNNIRTAATDEE